MHTIFVIAVFLCLFLALCNRAANDPHIEVITKIANTGALPKASECFLCYHAKLYHVLCAVLLNLFHIRSLSDQLLVSQLVNVIAGAFALLVFRRFLEQLTLQEKAKRITFALIALNSTLIGINAQATNDSLVILFSTLSIYAVWKYIKNPSWSNTIFIALFVPLAGLSKGSGLVLFVCIMIVLIIKTVGAWQTTRETRLSVSKMGIIFVAFILLNASLGPYYVNYKELGSPIAVNYSIPKQPRPYFFAKTYVERPGIVSIFDSFLTFRFIDMLKQPSITNDRPPVPLHRTSFWSQLYGRSHSLHFNAWPPSWGTGNVVAVNVARIILLAALVPTFLAIVGFLMAVKQVCHKIYIGDRTYFAQENDWIFLVFILGLLAMLIKLNIDYRDFAFIKAIYIFPALMCIAKFIADGFEYICAIHIQIATYIWMSLVSLVSLYCIDVAILIGHLLLLYHSTGHFALS